MKLLDRLAALRLPVPAPPADGQERLCDGPDCDRLVHPARAHTHHHEPGCGIDVPHVEFCRCDYYLCPACCPCDVSGLLGS